MRVDDGVELVDVALGAAIARRGNPNGRIPGAFETVAEIAHGTFERRGDFVGGVGEVHIHERAADDAERESRHFVMQSCANTLTLPSPRGRGFRDAFGPLFQQALRAGNDGAGVVVHTRFGEGGLHEAALAEPEFAFAVQEAIAEHGAKQLERRSSCRTCDFR